MKITYDELMRLGACRERRDAFLAEFPAGATHAQAAAWASEDDLAWVVCNSKAHGAAALAALAALLARTPPCLEDALLCVVCNSEAHADAAAAALLASTPPCSEYSLLCIVDNSEAHGAAARKELSRRYA